MERNEEHIGKGKNQEFTDIFEKFLRSCPYFPEVHHIIRENAHGKILIIGGFVYRPIITTLYGEIPEPPQIDIDFLIQRSPEKSNLYLPRDWDFNFSSYGNLYMVKGNVRIDLNYLSNFHSINSRNFKPRFRHFFTGTPLDIQSIAYDLTDREVGVNGWRGINSIKRKIVRVNNIDEAVYDAKNKGKTVEELVKQKAQELSFEAEFDQEILKKMQQKSYREVGEKIKELLED